jgi:hypothetical protein
MRAKFVISWQAFIQSWLVFAARDTRSANSSVRGVVLIAPPNHITILLSREHRALTV